MQKKSFFTVPTVLILLILSYIFLVTYQSFVLRCQPNCAQEDLRGVYLHRPFTKSDGLFELKLHDVDFQEADFRGANLRSALMRRSNFGRANLEGVVLYNTDLAWSNLNGANLRNADLRYANLYATDLGGTDLRGANLEDTYWAGSKLLVGAKYNATTIWPADFDPERAGAIFVE